jgi:hypothetical protein
VVGDAIDVVVVKAEVIGDLIRHLYQLIDFRH